MKVEEIKKGDQFIDGGRIYWTAVGDARPIGNGTVSVLVRFADGGSNRRGWDIGTEINILRDDEVI